MREDHSRQLLPSRTGTSVVSELDMLLIWESVETECQHSSMRTQGSHKGAKGSNAEHSLGSSGIGAASMAHTKSRNVKPLQGDVQVCWKLIDRSLARRRSRLQPAELGASGSGLARHRSEHQPGLITC